MPESIGVVAKFLERGHRICDEDYFHNVVEWLGTL